MNEITERDYEPQAEQLEEQEKHDQLTAKAKDDKAAEPDEGIVLAAMPVDTLVERVDLLKEAMKRCMFEKRHYGTIPGCTKPSLWKPGGELICTLFQLGTRYPKDQFIIERDRGHFIVTLTCVLFHIPSGRTVGEGVGAASTLEYKYRVQTEDRYADHGQPIKAKFTPYDFYNTVIKMARKRAMIDAILTATAASEIFTQDAEDNPELYGDQPRLPLQQERPQKRPYTMKPSPSAPATVKGKVEGNYVINKTDSWDFEGKTYYSGEMSDGLKVQTSDKELGFKLCGFGKGARVHLVMTPSPKPGKFYLEAIEEEALP